VTVLIAPDKFKGSLTASQVVRHLGRGLRRRGIEHRGLPLADGGDGSVDAALAAGFRPVEIEVAAATGERHRAVLAFDGATAVVEVANTCGLHTLLAGRLAPLRSSSTGVGHALAAALRLGANRIVLALGGSASTDGGTGMLAALGAEFRDADGRVLRADGASLRRIRAVDAGGLPDLGGVELVLASEVQNPLTGADGAAVVYGPQKGADPAEVAELDAGLTNLVGCLATTHSGAGRLAAAPAAGAAGGLGFAGMLLGGRAVSGADYFLDLLQFETQLSGCDLVLTGEGRIDDQTLQGKLPAAVARRAAPLPVVAVVGRNELSDPARRAMGLRAVHAIADLTERSPAGDPVRSGRLLEELGRTIPLPTATGTASSLESLPRAGRSSATSCASRPRSGARADIGVQDDVPYSSCQFHHW
jgi:glycerate 2-kinase